jgi:hypothetical protein
LTYCGFYREEDLQTYRLYIDFAVWFGNECFVVMKKLAIFAYSAAVLCFLLSTKHEKFVLPFMLIEKVDISYVDKY